MEQTLDVASVTAALRARQTAVATGERRSLPWREIDVRDSVDSTNQEAGRRPDPWRVVVAAHQSAGRGRLARGWDSPAGLSTAVSAVVPLPASGAQDWGWLPLLAGMSVRDAVREVTGVLAMLKWPNDVLAREEVTAGTRLPEGRGGAGWLKLSGVLCEVSDIAPAHGAQLAVVGAGTNVAQRRDQLPVPTATSLALCGADPVDPAVLVAAYLAHLAHWHRVWLAGGPGLDGLRTAYRSACLSIGAEVRVHLPTAADRRGLVTGVDGGGRLLIRDDGGHVTAYAAGDVIHLRPAPGHAADPA